MGTKSEDPDPSGFGRQDALRKRQLEVIGAPQKPLCLSNSEGKYDLLDACMTAGDRGPRGLLGLVQRRMYYMSAAHFNCPCSIQNVL